MDPKQKGRGLKRLKGHSVHTSYLFFFKTSLLGSHESHAVLGKCELRICGKQSPGALPTVSLIRIFLSLSSHNVDPGLKGKKNLLQGINRNKCFPLLEKHLFCFRPKCTECLRKTITLPPQICSCCCLALLLVIRP